jgi:hypothetical protein
MPTTSQTVAASAMTSLQRRRQAENGGNNKILTKKILPMDFPNNSNQ